VVKYNERHHDKLYRAHQHSGTLYVLSLPVFQPANKPNIAGNHQQAWLMSKTPRCGSQRSR